MPVEEPGHGEGAMKLPDESAAERERKDVVRRRDELLSDAGKSAMEGTAGGTAATTGDAGSAQALAGLGLQFVVVILLCVYAGLWLDKKLGTAPWFVVVGAVVGATSGFFVMYRVLMAENEKKKNGK